MNLLYRWLVLGYDTGQCFASAWEYLNKVEVAVTAAAAGVPEPNKRTIIVQKCSLSTFRGKRDIENIIYFQRELLDILFKQIVHYGVHCSKFCNYKFYGNSHY